MRARGVAFLGLAFAAYWLLTGELNDGKRLSLAPVKPGLVRVLNPPYDLEEPPGSSPVVLLEEHENLRDWLKSEAIKVGQPDLDPAGTSARLSSKASQLSKKDLHFLKQTALNRNFSSDERFLAVYILGLAGTQALDALRELSLARIPGVPDDRRHSDEVILRTHAIEALVQKLSRAEARTLLQELLSRTSDPIIARHVQYWLNRLSS